MNLGPRIGLTELCSTHSMPNCANLCTKGMHPLHHSVSSAPSSHDPHRTHSPLTIAEANLLLSAQSHHICSQHHLPLFFLTLLSLSAPLPASSPPIIKAGTLASYPHLIQPTSICTPSTSHPNTTIPPIHAHIPLILSHSLQSPSFKLSQSLRS